MNAKNDNAQGHWVLAKMGKKVLRPGGKELTLKLIDGLGIKSSDDVVEFAPGLGFTASITLKAKPKSYTGVELNKNAVEFLQNKIKGDNAKVVHGNANDTKLPDAYADKVYGEAMLTMQSAKQKAEIVKEAHRILKQGGLYGIHEIALTADSPDESLKNNIYQDMKGAIKSNVAPIPISEWEALLVSEGFVVKKVITNPMHLLKVKRMINDEGFFRTLKIFFNILTHPSAAKRIRGMRKVFRQYGDNITAIAIVAEKQ